VPAGADDPAVSVRVDDPEPGAAINARLNVAVVAVGSPDAVSAIAEVKPPITTVVMVDVPLLPGATVTEVGEANMVKLGDVAVPASAAIRPVPFGLPQPVTRS
jgi:hypothetical protein